jgi:hypothetical protein
MKRILLILSLFLPAACFAQQEIKWAHAALKVGDAEYELHLKARLQPPWHIYSQQMKAGGPVPTKFEFEPGPGYDLSGPVKENGLPVSRHEPVFDMQVRYYRDSVDFVQRVKLKTGEKIMITGKVSFMICKADRCQPPATKMVTWELN